MFFDTPLDAQSLLRHQLAQTPETLLSHVKDENSQRFLKAYAIGECHCHPIKSRGLEGGVDDRKNFKKKIIDSLQALKKNAVAILGIGTGYLLPTASLVASLVEKGMIQIDLTLVDPFYHSSHPEWLHTFSEFKKLMRDCGIRCITKDKRSSTIASSEPTIYLSICSDIKKVQAPQLDTMDVAYAYDMFPNNNDELLALLTIREKLKSIPVHLSLDVNADFKPSKERILSLFNPELIYQITGGSSGIPTYQRQWEALIQALFKDEGDLSFNQLEAAFQTKM